MRYFKTVMAVFRVSLDLGKQAHAGLVQGQGVSRNVNGYIPREESSVRDPDGWEGITAAMGTVPLNIGLLLSQSLREVEPRFRPPEIQSILAGLIRSAEGDLVALDHTEILFQRDLQLDPLRMLLQQSRNKVLLVKWPGVLNEEKLVYGEPHHPEYRCYEEPDAVLCCLNQEGER